MVNAVFTAQNDSVIFNSYKNDMLVPVRYDTLSAAMQNTTLLEEGFFMMQKGDSATFNIQAENLYERTFGASLPPNIPRGSLITCQVKAEEVYTPEAYTQWQEEQIKKKQAQFSLQSKQQLENDITIIDAYLQENNLNAQTTPPACDTSPTMQAQVLILPREIPCYFTIRESCWTEPSSSILKKKIRLPARL